MQPPPSIKHVVFAIMLSLSVLLSSNRGLTTGAQPVVEDPDFIPDDELLCGACARVLNDIKSRLSTHLSKGVETSKFERSEVRKFLEVVCEHIGEVVHEGNVMENICEAFVHEEEADYFEFVKALSKKDVSLFDLVRMKCVENYEFCEEDVALKFVDSYLNESVADL